MAVAVIVADKKDKAGELADELSSQLREFYVAAAQRFLAAMGRDSSNYGKYRLNWDGGVDKYGTRTKPVWPELAAFVRKNKCVPGEYVQVQFDYCDQARLPNPWTFMTPAALERYRNTRRTETPDFAAELSRQRNAAAKSIYVLTKLHGLTEEAAWRTTLADMQLELSPLFRYAAAIRFGAGDLASLVEKKAMAQYACAAEAYDAAWKSILPAEIKSGGLGGVVYG